MTTIFKKIIDGQAPAEIVFENDDVLAFKDIHPQAPVHLLIIPKKEISNLQSLQPEDYPLMIAIAKVAQQLAEEYQVGDGYRLVTNNGSMAGQVVPHLHFHLLGGRKLGGIC